VVLVSANVSLPDPAGTRVIRVTSAREMRDAVLAASADADAVVMAAAVADFRPVARSDSKIKKSGAEPEPIHLVQNPDILTELSARRAGPGGRSSQSPPEEHGPDGGPIQSPLSGRSPADTPGFPRPQIPVEGPRPGQVIVGFAAETDPELADSAAKLARKGCDLLVVNRVGNGLAFGTRDNEAVVLGADGTRTEIAHGPKDVLADTVWDLVTARLG
jgi:phosphopantothenoylcysteine decarboxylase/phosphopantothenate--cysteine ligase